MARGEKKTGRDRRAAQRAHTAGKTSSEQPFLALPTRSAGAQLSVEEIPGLFAGVESEYLRRTYIDRMTQMVRDPHRYHGSDPAEGTYISRELLEALVALHEGVSVDEVREQWAEKSWPELYTYLKERDRNLVHLGSWLEIRQRMASEKVRTYPLEVLETTAETAPALRRVGPGRRSGRLEDYTRTELANLLGLRKSDTMHLSIDELRARCLQDQLVPQHEGAPSHLELALRYTGMYSSYSLSYRPDMYAKELRRNLNKSYRELCTHHGVGYRDDGGEGARELSIKIAKALRHVAPDLVPETMHIYGDGSEIKQIVQRLGIEEKQLRPYRVAAEAPDGLDKPRLQLALGEKLDKAFALIGGQPERMPHKVGVRKILGRTRGGSTHGQYVSYSSGRSTVNLSQDAEQVLASAAVGRKTEPHRLARAISTLCHELHHAAAKGAGGPPEGTPTFTINEGVTESLARLDGERFARETGLWREDQSYYDFNASSSGAYQHEVTMIQVLGDLCVHGRIDADRLGKKKEDGYGDPRASSAEVQDWLRSLHHENTLAQRARLISERIEKQLGLDEGLGEQMLYTLQECTKDPRLSWHLAEVVDDDGELRKNYIPATRTLAEVMAEKLGHVPQAV